MKYQDWIQDRIDGKLTQAEMQIFDHELAENHELQMEWEAWTLTDRVLKVAAEEPSLLDSMSVKHRFTWRTITLSLLIMVMVSAGLFLWQSLNDSSKEMNTETPIMQDWKWYPFDRDVAEIDMEVPQDEMVAMNEEIKTIESTIPSADTVEKMKATIRTPKRNTDVESIPEMTPTEIVAALDILPTPSSEQVIIADTTISEGSDIVLTAHKEIILKPGFHAQAGARFNAKVNRSID